uniref:DNA-directed RNA polymerase n=1 Tax=Lactuca sativa TaxID=4236 RepID=A0A9R1XEH8_LACSA|nr:hypothetical protein LSAT_V11C400196120 [Lactuca sativa]
MLKHGKDEQRLRSKTILLSYNADFDGDEMNVHLPQDEISRSEAYNIVNANNQYIVPARGYTVRGLIEDHIVSSVLLTMQDTFLNSEQFNQLLYASGVFNGGNSRHGKNSSIDKGCFVKLVLPAVWKPKPLWTGKQVITTLLNHLTRGYMPCIVHNKVIQYTTEGLEKALWLVLSFNLT